MRCESKRGATCFQLTITTFVNESAFEPKSIFKILNALSNVFCVNDGVSEFHRLLPTKRILT